MSCHGTWAYSKARGLPFLSSCTFTITISCRGQSSGRAYSICDRQPPVYIINTIWSESRLPSQKKRNPSKRATRVSHNTPCNQPRPPIPPHPSPIQTVPAKAQNQHRRRKAQAKLLTNPSSRGRGSLRPKPTQAHICRLPAQRHILPSSCPAHEKEEEECVEGSIPTLVTNQHSILRRKSSPSNSLKRVRRCIQAGPVR